MHAAVLIHNTSHPLGAQLRETLRTRLDCPAPSLLPFDHAEEVLRARPGGHAGRRPVAVPRPRLESVAENPNAYQRPCPRRRSQFRLQTDSATLHEGADHYLDEDDLETQLDAVLLRLQIKEEATRPPAGQLIALLGASGGTGASTLAVNVAAVLARDAGRCALIDLKPGVGDLAALLDLKPTHNLADLCLNAGRMDRAMFESALVVHASGVHLLAPPQMYEDIRLVTAAGVQKTLNLAREAFRFSVVDLEDCYHEEQVAVLRQADFILLVFRLDFTSLRSTRRILDYLEQAGLPGDRVRLVINRYGQAKELPLSEAENALGARSPISSRTIRAPSTPPTTRASPP